MLKSTKTFEFDADVANPGPLCEVPLVWVVFHLPEDEGYRP